MLLGLSNFTALLVMLAKLSKSLLTLPPKSKSLETISTHTKFLLTLSRTSVLQIWESLTSSNSVSSSFTLTSSPSVWSRWVIIWVPLVSSTEYALTSLCSPTTGPTLWLQLSENVLRLVLSSKLTSGLVSWLDLKTWIRYHQNSRPRLSPLLADLSNKKTNKSLWRLVPSAASQSLRLNLTAPLASVSCLSALLQESTWFSLIGVSAHSVKCAATMVKWEKC